MVGNVMEAMEAEPMMEWNPEFRYGHQEVRTASALVMERVAGSQAEKTWERPGTVAGGQVIAYPAAGDHRTGTEMGNRESQTEMAKRDSQAARGEDDMVSFPQRSNTDWYDLTEVMPDWQEADAGLERLLELEDREEVRDEAVPEAKLTESSTTAIPPVRNQEETALPRYVLAVGTSRNKNLSRIAESLQGLPVRLLILGKPDEADRMLLSCLTPGYRYCSGLSEKGVIRLYRMVARSGGILLFPSLYEGFGRPILEAQSMGIPVVTSNIDPMREVAGKGALLVNPMDTGEIREAVKSLLHDDALYHRMQIKGLLNARRYRSDKAAEAYATIYREITRLADAISRRGQDGI